QTFPRYGIALWETGLHRVLRCQKNLVLRRVAKWVSDLRSYHYDGEWRCYLFELAQCVVGLFGSMRRGRMRGRKWTRLLLARAAPAFPSLSFNCVRSPISIRSIPSCTRVRSLRSNS